MPAAQNERPLPGKAASPCSRSAGPTRVALRRDWLSRPTESEVHPSVGPLSRCSPGSRASGAFLFRLRVSLPFAALSAHSLARGARWPPTYNMTLSTITMVGNGSGFAQVNVVFFVEA